MYPEDKKHAVDYTRSTDPAGSGHSTHFEKPVLPASKSRAGGTRLDTLSTILLYLAILFFIIGFNFRDVMVGNWYQQFMPDINGKTIQDITFLDSLTGYASARQNGDTSYILKTTNRGDNWQIIYRNFFAMTRLQFIDDNTGYAGGGYLYKTINGGFNWTQINTPAITVEDFKVISEDTMFVVWSEGAFGGVFRTTDGGSIWQQVNLAPNNPDRIYMYNGRIGFVCNLQFNTGFRKTTDGGNSWTLITNGESFNDMYFVDSMTGWRSPPMKKTTNGGMSWTAQIVPSGGNLVGGGNSFSNINKDTIWMGGGYIFYPGNGNRGIINLTTNGGENWFYQMPDTSFGPSRFNFVNFVNKLNGWGYSVNFGVHTTTGGDGTFLTPVQQISSQVANDFKLFNNYPNPFNAMTKLKFQMSKQGHAVIKLYDVTGKEVSSIVNEKLNTGEYEIIFNAGNLSSGVYFYSLIIEGKVIDTKK